MGKERKQRYREPETEDERERGRIIDCDGSECIVAKLARERERVCLSFVRATSLQRSLRKKIEKFTLLLIKRCAFSVIVFAECSFSLLCASFLETAKRKGKKLTAFHSLFLVLDRRSYFKGRRSSSSSQRNTH